MGERKGLRFFIFPLMNGAFMTGHAPIPAFRELRTTLVLAAPITANHLSQMIIGFVDTLMIGQVGVVPLAASAFANLLIHILLMIGIGLLSSVAILVAHAHGSGNNREAGEIMRRGMFLAGGAGLISLVLVWIGFPFLGYLGQPPEVVEASKSYIWLLAFSLVFVLGILNLRNFSEAENAPWAALWTGLTSVFLNVVLNWILIYGNLGAPALGLTGAGIATLASRIFNFFALYFWLKYDPRFTSLWPAKWFHPVSPKALLVMLKLGLPVSLQLLMEIGAFSAATLFMGWLGIVEIASHQIAITCAATTFMIPLGLSLAVAIRVGQVVGRGETERARVIGFSALGFGLLCSALFATLFIGWNRGLASLFTNDPATLALTASLLVIAGVFQVFDGSQVVAIGALRGCKDVQRPTWIIFAAYWLVAIPLGLVLAFPLERGGPGLWVGLAGGLAVASIGLVYRFNRLSRPRALLN